MSTMTLAAADVLAERQRQIQEEGRTPEHDDAHEYGELAEAAGCYALHVAFELQTGHQMRQETPIEWPWSQGSWKPKNPRRDLVRAAALILAEIERLDRAEGRT